jgi:hypothetical protein
VPRRADIWQRFFVVLHTGWLSIYTDDTVRNRLCRPAVRYCGGSCRWCFFLKKKKLCSVSRLISNYLRARFCRVFDVVEDDTTQAISDA